MSIEDYTRNLRGVNDKSDFSPEFLVTRFSPIFISFTDDVTEQQGIYDSIRKREIVMPEEHTGQLGFEYAWKELLVRSRHSGTIVNSLLGEKSFPQALSR